MLRKNIIDIDCQKQYLESLRRIISRERKIVAWGTGRGAKKLLCFLRKMNWDGDLKFVDSNKKKCDHLFYEYQVVSPKNFFKNYYDPTLLVLITCADVKGVKETIASYKKHEKIQISDLTSIDLDSQETWFEYIWNNMDNFSETYELLADEKSKKVYAGLLNYRISRDGKYLLDISDAEYKQYFEEELFDIHNITFVDCGAYIGDTIDRFIKMTNGDYKKIFTFEPDKKIYEILTDNVHRNGWRDIYTYNIGNYKEKGVFRFSSDETGNEMSGHISESGNVSVDVDSLDHIIHEQVDLIKMDIEGAEYDALLGCKSLIEKFNPVLAICIYHKKDDYFKILRLVHMLNPKYKLYVRQYALTDNETILYAVP